MMVDDTTEEGTRGDGKEGVTTVEKEAIRGRLEEEMGKGMNAWASAIFFFASEAHYKVRESLIYH